MSKKELIEEVKKLYMDSEFNEFAQWAEETLLKMIPYLPIEQLKWLKNDLKKIQKFMGEED